LLGTGQGGLFQESAHLAIGMVPSADLGWHRDMPQFGEVSGISLLTACRMRLGIAEAGLFGFSLGGLVAYAVALGAPLGSAS